MSDRSSLPLSIQLYSLRTELEHRFRETLQGLARIGFKHIEFAGIYGGLEPQQLTDFLQELGLQASGLHAMPGGPRQLLDHQSDVYRYALALQCEFVSISMTLTPENLTDGITQLRQMRRMAADRGLTLTYHNHDREFDQLPDGRTILDAIREATMEDHLQFQYDVFFAYCRGVDPCDGLERFRGRIPQIHFNDLDRSGLGHTDTTRDCMQHSTELGAGCLDLPAIYKKARDTDVRLVVLEQHTSQRPPLESALINFNYYRELIAATA
ncbi:MAG: sugar phosphate isomerase/epimerase family protein [Kiritimatiellia bacterium]|nr:sugar phosphate isomerase/epimerase [Lentisphaerota bacterium]